MGAGTHVAPGLIVFFRKPKGRKRQEVSKENRGSIIEVTERGRIAACHMAQRLVDLGATPNEIYEAIKGVAERSKQIAIIAMGQRNGKELVEKKRE